MSLRKSALAPLLVLALAACSRDDASLAARSKRVFGPTPKPEASEPAALVALGRALYSSTELSVNGTQSCASCHPVEGRSAGADGLAVSAGALGQRGKRNTPTVLNAAFHFTQFWDGRARTLEEQAAGPIMNPVEMAMPDEKVVAARLRSLRGIDASMFRAAFPGEADPFTLKHAARAIAAFERTLHTTDRFDEFQNGQLRALTAEEKRGLDLFMSNGCTSCHGGPLLGGDKFQRLGIVNRYQTADLGRFEVTRQESDKHVFKVPSLRNVALTPPYFHDGGVGTLPEAVDRMAWHQLGTKFKPSDRDAIVAFLGALSDKKRTED
jgi:cytochrome c peroxidase